MLKIIGVLLVVASSAGLGFSMSRDMRLRIEQLRYLKKILLMLQGEIKYVRSPLPEAFRNIGRRVREPFASFFEELASDMDHMEGVTFRELWEKQIGEHFTETNLTKRDLEQLRQMGENMGYLDQEMQLNTIGLYAQQMDAELQTAEGTYGTKSRVYNCLGVMAGIFIAILIL